MVRKLNCKTLGTQERDVKNNMRKNLGAFVILILTVYLGLQCWLFKYSQQNDITNGKPAAIFLFSSWPVGLCL